MKRFLLAALLIAAPFAKGEAQTFQFFGCDVADRSCHLMRFEHIGTIAFAGTHFDEFKTSGHSTFSAPGVFKNFSAWQVSPFDYTIGWPLNEDVFTGPAICSWSDPVSYLSWPDNRPCPNDFEWAGLGNGATFFQPVGWQPTSAAVTVGYAGDRSVTTIPLTAVPEPSSYALVAVGLAAMLAARRNRWMTRRASSL